MQRQEDEFGKGVVACHKWYLEKDMKWVLKSKDSSRNWLQFEYENSNLWMSISIRYAIWHRKIWVVKNFPDNAWCQFTARGDCCATCGIIVIYKTIADAPNTWIVLDPGPLIFENTKSLIYIYKNPHLMTIFEVSNREGRALHDASKIYWQLSFTN
jgi:hypothetical protein